MASSPDYLLGANASELERMRFQHKVWGPVTDAFFTRLGIGRGTRVLDVGAGPGFVTEDLRARVGNEGHVTALEPSAVFVDHLRRIATEQHWQNVEVIQGRVEDATLPENVYDLVFMRWVVAFVPDRPAFLRKLAATVKPGGLLAVEDYWYEGLSMRPRGTAFDRLPDIVRSYYRAGGGDAYAIGDIPSTLRPLGFTVAEITPRQQAGGPESGVFQWAHQFFRQHIPLMADKGVITPEERDLQLANYASLASDPATIFFSPIVLDLAMRKTGAGDR